MYEVKKHNNIKVKFGILCVLLIVCAMQTIDSQRSTTILYSTDISVDGDLDDYFDLVAIESLDNVDVKIIVDGTDMTQKKSGVQAIRDLTEIGGREPDILLGRNNNLSASADADISYELIRFLEGSKGEIDIVTVGSLRDIAALYNYSPKLFKNKVGRIYVFAGDAEGTMKEQ